MRQVWFAGLVAAVMIAAPAVSAPVKVDPAKAGWNAAALAEAEAYAKAQKTTGFLVIDHDRIVAEDNWPVDTTAATFRANFVHGISKDGAIREDVASQQKSFVAILAGV